MGVERAPPVSAHRAPDLVFEYASSAAKRALEIIIAGVDCADLPGGVPFGTLTICKPGAINAALLAVAIPGKKHPEFRADYKSHEAPRHGSARRTGRTKPGFGSELQVVPALGENQAALNVLDNRNERVERVVFFLEGPDGHPQETDG
jgi:hypothetical protein